MTTQVYDGSLAALLGQLSTDKKTKGDQFELLAKWWLQTDPVYKATFRQVWHFSKWPGRWSNKDLGTDLIAEDFDGKIWAIQAKAYKPGSYVSHNDMGKFLADSNRDEVDVRLLISTSDGLGPNAKSVFKGQPKDKPVVTVLRSGLEKSDVTWPVSLTELYAVQPEPKTPRDYQIEAINDVVNGFAGADRGQLLMVSGTGKTLTGLFIAEKLGAKTILVLLPSLLLLKQTLKVWRANATVDFLSLPVGSDATANNFGLDVPVSELGYPTTTDSEEIATFLRRDGVKVVFSTYQSSREIAAAQKLAGVPAFDLVIADEAHNTAGSVDSYFATVLHDEVIKADRRLFMTATPKNYTQRVLDRAVAVGDEKASMNDEKRYGTVFHELPFAKALDLKLVTDYQVAIVAVTDDQLRQWANNSKLVRIDGNKTNARKVASQVAVLKAMREFDMDRVITYHRLVARARDFAVTLPLAREWLPEVERPSGSLWARHIHGEMTVDDRGLLLEQLGGPINDERRVLSNAKVLTEGVDVPALGGIAILDPKRSAIDIYQSAGRAIRLDPTKANPADEIATIVLPVFVATDEHQPTQEVLRSAFEPVWRELLAMRLLDERFAEWVDGFRLQLGGPNPPSWNTALPPMVITNLHEVFGEEFARDFALKLIDVTTSSWLEMFGVLKQFVAEHGHAVVPSTYEVNGRKLGDWVSNQRSFYVRGTLNADRKDLLSKVDGWVWNATEAQWEEGFRRLLEYVEAHGHARVPDSYITVDGYKLGSWAGWQRQHRNTLEADRKDRLSKVDGWVWNLRADLWEQGFNRLLDYVKTNGDALVPQSFTADGYPLGVWVTQQRVRYAKDTLDADRKDRLSKVDGWVWNPIAAQWEEGFRRLLEYVEAHGHAVVPRLYTVDGYKLGLWVVGQRSSRVKGKLDADRMQRLQELETKGWVWHVKDAQWEEGFRHLLDYVETHGDAVVPRPYTVDGYKLGHWVSKQRTNKNTLKADRKDRLSKVKGWKWDARP